MTTLTVDSVDQTDYLQDRSLRFKLQTLDFTLIDPVTDPVMGDVVEVDDPPWIGTITTRELNPFRSLDVLDHRFVKVTATNNTVATFDTAPFGLSDAPDDSATFGYAGFSIREQMNEDVLERRLSCRVFEPGLRPGMEIIIDNGAESLTSATYTITEIDVGFPIYDAPTFDIECSEGTFAEAIPPITLNDVIDSSGGACRLGTAVPDTSPTAYYGEVYAGGIGATLTGGTDEEVQFIDQSETTSLKFVDGSALVIVGSHLVIPASTLPNAGVARVTGETGDARIYARIQCDTTAVPAYSSACAATLAWTEDDTGDVTATPDGPSIEFLSTVLGGTSSILTATPSVLDEESFTISFTFQFNSNTLDDHGDNPDTNLTVSVADGGLYGVRASLDFRVGGPFVWLLVGIGDTETVYEDMLSLSPDTPYTMTFTYGPEVSSVYVEGIGNAGVTEPGTTGVEASVGNLPPDGDIIVTVSVDDFCTVLP